MLSSERMRSTRFQISAGVDAPVAPVLTAAPALCHMLSFLFCILNFDSNFTFKGNVKRDQNDFSYIIQFSIFSWYAITNFLKETPTFIDF